MCGIIAIVSDQQVSKRLIEALKRLEYRGYDSSGVATLFDGHLMRCRAEGKILNLEKKLKNEPLKGCIGIGHTRWATHGIANESNAHPHASEKVAVVHNGIIENYQEIRKKLQDKQYRFESDTDTEVVVHLITDYLSQGLTPKEAAQKSFEELEGAFSIVAIFQDNEQLLIGTRKGTPLAVGFGKGTERFLASDAYALAPLTNQICFLEDGDRVEIDKGQVVIYANDNQVVERPIKTTEVSGALVGKGKYPHFMLKEIFEQPVVLAQTLSSYINPERSRVFLPKPPFDLADVPRYTIVACGTAYYAGMVAKYWLEQMARMPVELDVASEFRYRKGPMPENGITLVISQSGETLDTLEALRYAKSQGQKIVAVVNTPESTIARESDYILHTKAGQEISVASTKATTAQLATLACLTFWVARERKTLPSEKLEKLAYVIRELPSRIADILNHDEAIKTIAKNIYKAQDVLFIGRGSSYPIALEGALKLKEISYIHAEGYPAGEMKHGPISLMDDKTPVVAIAPFDELFEKTASNIREAAARGGKIFLISDQEGCEKLKDIVTWSVALPKVNSFIAPIIYAVPVQLLAYHVAVLKGTNIDQPRNLAKSVTVE